MQPGTASLNSTDGGSRSSLAAGSGLNQFQRLAPLKLSTAEPGRSLGQLPCQTGRGIRHYAAAVNSSPTSRQNSRCRRIASRASALGSLSFESGFLGESLSVPFSDGFSGDFPEGLSADFSGDFSGD